MRFGRSLGHIAALLLVVVIASGCSVTLNPTDLRAAAVPIPGGAGGIGFDDMFYDSGLGKLVDPAGGTGNLDLIDPDTLKVTTIPGFSVDTEATGHSAGSTSVASAHGLLFALDRTTPAEIREIVATAIRLCLPQPGQDAAPPLDIAMIERARASLKHMIATAEALADDTPEEREDLHGRFGPLDDDIPF